MYQDQYQQYNLPLTAQNRRGQQEGVKQEQAQYSLTSLSYPNNIISRNGSNNKRNADEHLNPYTQNVNMQNAARQSYQSSNNMPNQNKVFNDSHEEIPPQNYPFQVNNPMTDNLPSGQQNRNYHNVDHQAYIPTTHVRSSSQNQFSAPANPNFVNPYISLNPNVQSYAPGAQQQPAGQVYQTCPSHPKYDITNICVAETCIEPLCPECVKIHTYMHNQKETPTNIDTIICKRDQCIEYVRELRENFLKEESILNKIGDIDKGDIFQQCIDQIHKARDLAVQNINSHFNTFEVKIKQKIHEIRQNHPHNFGSINSKIQAMIHEVTDMEMKLQSPQYVKYIIQILSDDFNIDFERIQQDVDYGIEYYLNQLFKVSVNPGIMEELDELLKKYIYTDKVNLNDYQWRDGQDQITHEVMHSNIFVKKENKNQNNRDKDNQNNIQDLFESSQKKLVPQPLDYNTVSFPTQQTQQIHQNNSDIIDMNDNPFEDVLGKPRQNQAQQQPIQRPKNEYINPYQANPPQNFAQNNGGSKGLDGDMQVDFQSQRDDRIANINIYDYFTPDCLLNLVHFFQDNSKFFHFLDLSQLSKDPTTQEWQTVELNINFKIPMFHRSIITPNGKIFLVGGIDVLHKNRSVKSTYYLDMNRNTLDLCASMNYERNSHSLVIAQDSIFVVGGLNSNDEDIYLTSCERFDIETQKWIQIADIQEGVAGTCLSNFNDKYVYRFGGKTYLNGQTNTIERYNIQDDFWEYIPFQFVEQIPCFGGSVQINDNEMIILGGQYGDINQKQALIARVDDQNPDIISFYQAKSLPSSGTFWQNPIIGGNVLFAMQNIKMDNSQMNYFSKKSFFVFNCRTWKELGAK